VHVLTGYLLYLLVAGTLSLPLFHSRFRRPDLLALFAALLWFVNPLQTQSVTYVVQRMNSMAAMFYLLAMILYLGARRRSEEGLPAWPGFAGCAAAGLLALATKEIAATLPLMILLYEFFFIQDLDRGWLRRALPWITGLLAVSLIIALIFLGTSPVQRITDSYEFRDFSMGQRLLTQPRVVLDYLGLFALPLPARLNLDHQVEISTSLLHPVSTLPALLALAGLFAAGLLLARRRRLISFAILWFLGNLAIESSVIALELMFEHRAYLPTMFIPLALLGLLWPRFTSVRPLLIGCSLLVLLLAALTWQRNETWSDPLTLWRDVVKKSPNKVRPLNNLSALLIDRGRGAEAMPFAARAIRLDPDNADAHYNLGTACLRAGRLEEAARSLEQSLRLDPDNAKAHTNLGGIRFSQGDLDRAMTRWEKALDIDPADPLANYNVAVQYEKQGAADRAIVHFRRYLEQESGDLETRMRVAALLEHQGWPADAATEYRKVLERSPNHPEARARLTTIEERSR
jgi:tetratricopeptide (TPR) repeat protein